MQTETTFRFKKDGETSYRVIRNGQDLGRIFSTYRCRQRMWRVSAQDVPGLGYWEGVKSTREEAAEVLASYLDDAAAKAAEECAYGRGW